MNSDFINNAGSPVIHNYGQLYLIGNRFEAGLLPSNSFVNSLSSFSIAECSFKGNGNPITIVSKTPPDFMVFSLTHPDNLRHYNHRRIHFFNSTSDIPLGGVYNGMLFNNSFSDNSNLSREWVNLEDSVATVLMPAPGHPTAQLLTGKQLPSGMSSYGGSSIKPKNLSASPNTPFFKVNRLGSQGLQLVFNKFEAPSLIQVELLSPSGKRLEFRKVDSQLATQQIIFNSFPSGIYNVVFKRKKKSAQRLYRQFEPRKIHAQLIPSLSSLHSHFPIHHFMLGGTVFESFRVTIFWLTSKYIFIIYLTYRISMIKRINKIGFLEIFKHYFYTVKHIKSICLIPMASYFSSLIQIPSRKGPTMSQFYPSIFQIIIYGSIVIPKFIFAEKPLVFDSSQTEVIDSVSLQSLELKLLIMERNLEIQAEEAEKNKSESATASAGKDGFSLNSADKENQIKLKLMQHVDGRFYFEDEANKLTNTFLLRKARPILEGTISRIYKFRLMPEFAGTVGILDAYSEITFHPNIRVRLGKSKTPLGLERFQSAQDLSLIEFAHPTSLTPNYDIGVSFLGDFQEEAYSYYFGIFNGAIDGASRDLDINDDKDIIGKVFAEPFKSSAVEWVQHFGIGLAGSFGRKEGELTSPETPTYKTKGQQTFFSFRSITDAPVKVVYDNITKITKNTSATLGDTGTVRAFGEGYRINPQASWYNGSLGILAEYVAATQTYKKGGDNLESDQDLTTTAWQVTANYVFTGEPVGFKGVKPRHTLLNKEGGIGAFEWVVQVSKLDIDQNSFPLLADPNKSVHSATTWSTGLNWYLSRNTKLLSEFSWTEFEGGAAQNQNRAEEKIALIRIQNSF